MSNHASRLRTLERILASQKCPQCQDHPTRIVATDPDTGLQWYSETPESSCPVCGRPAVVIDVQVPPSVDIAMI